MKTNYKFILIIIGIILLVVLAYHFGADSNRVWTEADEREAIAGCKKWGGEVVYDKNGKYSDCFYGGKMVE